MPQHPRRRFRRARTRVVTAAAALSLCASVMAFGTANADNTPTADQVADQIIAVQEKADAAAGQWTNLDDDARDIATQVDTTQAAVDAAAATYDAMEASLAEIAMNKYTGTQPQFIPFTDSLMHDVETDALAGFALGTSAVDLDQFGAAQRDLARKQSQLAGLQARNTTARDRVQAKRDDLDAQISQLSTLEDKLRDAEVKKAYEAKLAAKRKRDADAAAARDAAAAKALNASAVTNPVVGARGGAIDATPEPTTTAPTPTSASTATATATTAPAAGATPKATTTVPATTPVKSTPPATDPTPATTDPPPAVAPASGGLVCPVAGTVAFGDTWGDPRSGGRHHEGVDMISPFGTPVVAIDDGVANMKTTSLGGNSIGLKADNGTYYFYAHLSSWEGPSRAVHAGEVIGYVGHTGDTTVNHLHFEVHPGGGAAIDPYPTVRAIC